MPKTTKKMREPKEPGKFLSSLNAEDKALEIASYYGFRHMVAPVVSKKDVDLEKKVKDINVYEPKNQPFDPLRDKIALLNLYYQTDLKFEALPLQIFYDTRKEPDKKTREVHLDMIGTPKSISDATITLVAYAILSELGYENLCVSINSLGDKDSSNKFIRELTNFARKNINVFSASTRHNIKKEILAILADPKIGEDEIFEGMPKSIDTLTEESRLHFGQYLEYLDALQIPYRIENRLTGDKNYSCYTVFTIVGNEPNKKSSEPIILASGGRYNDLSRKMGHKKSLPSVGVTLFLPKISSKKTIKKIKTPQFFFIQLGHDAKLRSLEIIELLRKAKIPVYQSLSRDKISTQMMIAEKYNFPYVLILGQKEIIDKSIIVRNMTNRSQDSVLIDGLVQYIKSEIKKK